MSTVIKVENLGKQYRLGEVGTGTLSHDLNRWWARMRGKEDPFAKIGEANDRTRKGQSEYVWALQDINFEVKAGEVLGIIGRNGAGKSTLLKILSKVTKPSTGQIKTRGRIASLLEVGTGFHPEMTGRENVYLNGAIMGMTKSEITRKFDEIVDFAGVERYIDTPVKRYSSGMYVRLAFAVAAHLEPEILIVDEVLAVGDAEFQKKCLGKMKDVSVNDGRTVLFVSHNMAAVSALCNKALVMSNGGIAYNGEIKGGVDFYLNCNLKKVDTNYKNKEPKQTDILEIRVLNKNGNTAVNHYFNDYIILEFVIKIGTSVKDAVLDFRVKDQTERNVFTSQFDLSLISAKLGIHTLQAVIPGNFLVPNRYFPVVAIHVPNREIISCLENEVMFEIEETGSRFAAFYGADYGCVLIDCEWREINE